MQKDILIALANEVANRTIGQSWPLFVIIAIVSVLSSMALSFLGARSAKAGEFDFTKKKFSEIKTQLAETTRVAKSVEYAISHKDWLTKERNSLRRSKLEDLVAAAFALSTWGYEQCQQHLIDEDLKTPESLSDFRMIAALYFPDLDEYTQKVTAAYVDVYVSLNDVLDKIKRVKLIDPLNGASSNENSQQKSSIEIFKEFRKIEVSQKSLQLSYAANDLATAARELMQNLTMPE